mmetsp:Transcript_14764/g.24043  ORF Transcript_14764/g.24043 Transcript_14764/m.24043 type:complete len:129 (+) Transcript_14764:372-758(+)
MHTPMSSHHWFSSTLLWLSFDHPDSNDVSSFFVSRDKHEDVGNLLGGREVPFQLVVTQDVLHLGAIAGTEVLWAIPNAHTLTQEAMGRHHRRRVLRRDVTLPQLENKVSICGGQSHRWVCSSAFLLAQ